MTTKLFYDIMHINVYGNIIYRIHSGKLPAIKYITIEAFSKTSYIILNRCIKFYSWKYRSDLSSSKLSFYSLRKDLQGRTDSKLLTDTKGLCPFNSQPGLSLTITKEKNKIGPSWNCPEKWPAEQGFWNLEIWGCFYPLLTTCIWD